MTRARLALWVVALSGASAFAGCGTDTTLDPGADAGIVLPDGSSGHDSSIVPIGDTGTTAPIDGGMVTPFDGGPPNMRDAGRFTRPDTGTTMMGGSDSGTTTGVMCGTAVCATGETCCITRGTGGMMISEMCAAAGACTGGATLACDGPEDCASGEVCCGSLAGMSAGAMCAASASCTRGAPLCHVAADCPSGSMCCTFMGLSVCSPFGCGP